MTGDEEFVRRKHKNKRITSIVAGVIIQIIIILLFILIVMRVRHPKVRLASVTVETLNVTSSSSSSPSFTMKLNGQVTVKNTNFGKFKFENSTATIAYRGTQIGEAEIFKARVKARSTKKINVTVDVNSAMAAGNLNLKSDLDSGVLSLNSYAKVDGKVVLFKIFKKKKSSQMNCTMDVDVKIKIIKHLACK